MALVPQQDVIVIRGPYSHASRAYDEAPQQLKQRLESYPACRIISITCRGNMADYVLTAVVETV
ncbi:hypothetical protein [Microbacterium sp. NPDC055357]